MVKKQFTDINGKPFNRNAMVAVLLIGTFADIARERHSNANARF